MTRSATRQRLLTQHEKNILLESKAKINKNYVDLDKYDHQFDKGEYVLSENSGSA